MARAHKGWKISTPPPPEFDGPRPVGVWKREYQIQVVSLLEALKLCKSVLDGLGIPFWLAWGTCLGAVRDGRFIPWDTDIDLGSLMPMMDNAERRQEIAKAFGDAGCMAVWDEEFAGDSWGGLTVNVLAHVEVQVELLSLHTARYYLEAESISASLSFYDSLGENILMDNYGGLTSFPKRLFTNPKEIDFVGEKFHVPNPPEEYLRVAFGKDWRIPKREGWQNDWKTNP